MIIYIYIYSSLRSRGNFRPAMWAETARPVFTPRVSRNGNHLAIRRNTRQGDARRCKAMRVQRKATCKGAGQRRAKAKG